MDNAQNARKRLILALDAPGLTAATSLLERVDGKVGIVKVGLELYTSAGPEAVRMVQHHGYEVFLDLKLHDIPNTVAGAVKAASDLGAAMLTVHTGGGAKMLAAAADAAGAGVTLLGVTLLTSIGAEDLPAIAVGGTPESVVERRAQLARESGLQGIVCSPKELGRVRGIIGNQMVAVTPGIRPSGASMADQKRVATPASAISDGADYLVVGRPISNDENPAAAADRIVSEIARALAAR